MSRLPPQISAEPATVAEDITLDYSFTFDKCYIELVEMLSACTFDKYYTELLGDALSAGFEQK